MPHRPHLDAVWTVLDLVRWGTEYFASRSIESPRLTMELLLCDVLETTRLKLYSEYDRPVLPEELARLRGFVTRRAHNEPLQYITGTAWFYSLAFAVTPDVLIPRQETEMIVDHAIKWSKTIDRDTLSCLDIGTGSACIPIAIAHHVANSVWTAIDVSKQALEIAEQNVSKHQIGNRVVCQRSNFLAEAPAGPFDLVTMNPPYIPAAEVSTLDAEVRDFEPHRALTDDADGLTFYRRLSEILPNLLAPDGLALLELGWQGADQVLPLFGEPWTTHIYHDLQGIPRVLAIKWA